MKMIFSVGLMTYVATAVYLYTYIDDKMKICKTKLSRKVITKSAFGIIFCLITFFTIYGAGMMMIHSGGRI